MIPEIKHKQPYHQSEATPASAWLEVRELSLGLQGTTILQDVSFGMTATGITSLIGPSGAGKSTVLRCLTGLLQDWQGEVSIGGQSNRDWPGGWDGLRRQIGLIGQKPCVFPHSIRANVLFGVRGFLKRRRASTLVETCLRQAALWDEVGDRLDSPAEQLSIGQQQRLCLARALAVKPQVLLLDEPTASLDPRSKQLIEESLLALSRQLPLLFVTHDLAQAQRLGGRVVFMCDGRVIEQGDCQAFFQRPQRLESREFISWSVCDC